MPKGQRAKMNQAAKAAAKKEAKCAKVLEDVVLEVVLGVVLGVVPPPSLTSLNPKALRAAYSSSSVG